MDIWMVAVAAGAGYIAKHFKKYKQDGGQTASESPFGDSFSGLPASPNPTPDKKWPFRRFSKRENLRKDDSEVRNEVSHGVSGQFDGEQGEFLGNQDGSNVFSTSSLFPGFIGDDGGLGDVEDMDDLYCKPSTPRSRLLLRSRGKFGLAYKPRSSLESCLMAQLYTERSEITEYMSSSVDPSSMQNLRSFFVTDGSRIISRASGDAFIVQNNIVEKNLQTYSEEKNGYSGVPLLSNIRSLDINGKEKANTRMKSRRELSNTNTTETTEHLNSTRGSSDAALLLCLGMSFGILSSYMAQRQEVEKLNRLLKQTQNLVQDLEEELEMKDSLIMEELKSEDHASQRINGGSSNDGSPHSITHEDHQEHLTNINNKQSVNQKKKDDSFSEIEAELEAELEMLEQNMTTSSTLDRRISNLVELDPDFEPDIAQGEFRVDILNRQANRNQDESGSTTTTHPPNYAVSPRELSLRLHELLESQLEERIRQLEAEIESKNHKSWKDFSSSDAGDEEPVVDEPVVLHLSGEALDAYNEACMEFAKLDESDEDGVCSVGSGDDAQKGGDDEKDFDEDEMEKLLIKHIVEKARQGSPVVLNAQRALFSE